MEEKSCRPVLTYTEVKEFIDNFEFMSQMHGCKTSAHNHMFEKLYKMKAKMDAEIFNEKYSNKK